MRLGSFLSLYLEKLECSDLWGTALKEMQHKDKEIIKLKEELKKKNSKIIISRIWDSFKKPIVWVTVLVSVIILFAGYYAHLPKAWQTWFQGLGQIGTVIAIIAFILQLMKKN